MVKLPVRTCDELGRWAGVVDDFHPDVLRVWRFRQARQLLHMTRQQLLIDRDPQSRTHPRHLLCVDADRSRFEPGVRTVHHRDEAVPW